MERLTERSLDYCTQHCPSEKMISCAFYKDGQAERCLIANMYDRLAAYEDTGLEPEEIEARQDVCLWIPEERFSEIIRAEAEDRLIVLPCKVGDVVYEIGYDCKIDYEDMCAFPAPSCDECEFVKRVIVPVRVDSVTAATFLIGKIGTIAFFSFEEAKAALKGVSEDA